MRIRQGDPSRRGSSPSDTSPLAFRCLLIAVLCVAALLRFYRLDAQSFWNDEGNSARIAERSLDLIVEGAAGDIHPPGYYLLLHAWRGLFGPSEFALRSLSVVAGIAMVIFSTLLSRRLFGRSVALGTAVLSASSPLAIYYSQEARMYALLGALSAASIYVALLTVDSVAGMEGSKGQSPILYLAAYALLNAAGLYTHYAFLFVLVAHNVVFGMRWLVAPIERCEQRWQVLIFWGTAQLGTFLLYLPWLPIAVDAAGWSSAEGGYRVGRALLDVGRVLVVGVTQSLGDAGAAMAVAVGLMLVGLWPRSDGVWERNKALFRRWGTTGLVVYLVIPLSLFFAFDLYKPAWLKFLVVLLPAFHTLVAHGVRNVVALVTQVGDLEPFRVRSVSRAVFGGLVVALVVLVYPSLSNLYFDPAYARDDYRELAADIRAAWRPGDAVVLNAPNQWEVFTYYFPDQDVYPAPYRPGPDGAASFLGPLLDRYRRLFVLYWGDGESDPSKRIESWLADHAYKASDRWYGGVRLAIYGLAPLSREPDTTLDVAFGERILLRGFSLASDVFTPGSVVPVTLFWEPLAAIDEPYKVSVQMLDGAGRLVSQMDTIPGDGLQPTTSWQPGHSMVDRYGIPVPADVWSGRYSLVVAVYHAWEGRRLDVEGTDGERKDAVELRDVLVAP